MAVIYSVSLLYTGRTDDALEIIDSLQIAENFSEEVASAAFTLASALIDCHLIEQGAVLSDLLLTLPSNSDAATFELAYRYSQARNDSDQCIEYLTKALEFLPEGSSEKRQELALALSQLYDEKGRIFTSDLIAESAPDYKPDDSDIEAIVDCIISGDDDGLRAFSSSFIKKLLGSTLPPPNYVYSIANWLIRGIGKRLEPLIADTDLLPVAPDIARYGTIGDLEKGLTDLFSSIASYIAAVYGEDEARRKISGEEESETIKAIMDYISEHKEEQIRLEDIAETVNLSPTYAAIYFRKQTGTTIRDYILKEKMEEARKRLLDKGSSVTDIAYSLGYHDYRSFSRAFKNLTGMTPSEFQESASR